MPVQTMKDQPLPVTKAFLFILAEKQTEKKMQISPAKYLGCSYTTDIKKPTKPPKSVIGICFSVGGV